MKLIENMKDDQHTTLFGHVYQTICSEIKSGKLMIGSKLPSRRALADRLGVSTTTVDTAYSQLIAEGFCESKPRSGVFVVNCDDLPDIPKKIAAPVRWDFGVGAVDTSIFPYSTWAKLMREVLTEQSDELLRIGDVQGDIGLRCEICRMLSDQRGIEVDPEQVIIAAGTDTLMNLILSLLGRECLYAVEDPGYPRARRALIAGGARIVPIPLEERGITISELYKTGTTAVYITPGRQFPTGRAMPLETRQSLLRWASETGGYILEDDCEFEYMQGSRQILPLIASREGRKVIYINTFARTLAPGLRISYMILPDHMTDRYREMYSACSVPGFEQETLKKFIAGGYYDRHIHRTRTIYRKRLECIRETVDQLNLGVLRDDSDGLFVLLDVNSKRSSAELVQSAREEGILLNALDDYYIIPKAGASKATVLLGLSGIETDSIKEGLGKLKEAWNED